MKKLVLIFLWAIPIAGVANSVRIKIINNSIWTIVRTNFRVDHGKYCVSDEPSGNFSIAAGEVGEFNSGPSCGATGNDGFVEYMVTVDGKNYQVYIGFDVPFIGDNSYDPKASYPFEIKHLSGGEGSDVFITYELRGGPSPKPPPAPLVLPTKGNRIITGYFIWDTDKTGQPYNNDIVTAFVVRAKSPRLFRMNNEGTGSQQYGNSMGSFEDMQDVGLAFFSLQKPNSNTIQSGKWQESRLAGNQQVVYYKIMNLPEGVPIDIQAEPAVSWVPGAGSEPKPDKPSAEYVAYCSVRGRGGNTINYTVDAAWCFMYGTGGSTSDNPDARRQILTKKGIQPGMDVFRYSMTDRAPIDNVRTKTLISPNASGTVQKTNTLNNSDRLSNQSNQSGQTLKSQSSVQQKASVQLKTATKKGG